MSGDPVCDVCAGSGMPASGKPCICGGSGKSHDEKAGLRKRAHELEFQVSAITGKYHQSTANVADLIGKLEQSNRLNGEFQKKVVEQRKLLWWVARDAGPLHIPKAELESIPEGAELLVWYEKLFDSMILKGLCTPTGQGEAVVEKQQTEKRADEAHATVARRVGEDVLAPGLPMRKATIVSLDSNDWVTVRYEEGDTLRWKIWELKDYA